MHDFSVNTSVPAGNTVANTLTGADFASTYTIPANDCTPGRMYRVRANGVSSVTTTAIDGQPKLDLNIKLGGTLISSSPSVNMGSSNAATHDNRPWRVELYLVCFTTGVSGTIDVWGIFNRNTGNTSSNDIDLQFTSYPLTVDTTTSQTIAINADWVTAGLTSNYSITLRQLVVEAIGP